MSAGGPTTAVLVEDVRTVDDSPAPASGITAHLMGRPFIEHTLDRLAAQGFTDVHVVSAGGLKVLRDVVGDGTRWGLQVHLHAAADPNRPWPHLRVIDVGASDGPVLLALAHRLVLTAGARPVDGDLSPFMAEGGEWSGWAWVCRKLFSSLSLLNSFDELALLIRNRPATTCDHVVDVANPAGLLDAHRRVLSGELEGIIHGGHEIRPGIFVGHRARIHPDARVEGPVWIAPWARVLADATVGPYAVIGERAVVDRGSLVTDSIVANRTYVGKGLHVEHALVQPDRVTCVRTGGSIRIRERWLISSLDEHPVDHPTVPIWERLLATVALALLWPILLAVAVTLFVLRRGNLFHPIRFGLGDRPLDDRIVWVFGKASRRRITGRRLAWKDLFLFTLPGLVAVVAGQLALVGVRPRSASARLAVAWPWTFVLKHQPGLIHPGLIQGVDPAYADAMNVADAGFCACRGVLRYPSALGHYLSLLLRA